MKLGDGLSSFTAGARVALDYPDIKFDDRIVDPLHAPGHEAGAVRHAAAAEPLR